MKRRVFLSTLLFGLLTACAAASDMSSGSHPTIAPSEAPASSEADTASAPSAPPADEAQTAVVYFSGTGNTAAVAQTMAQLLDCPAYEVVPDEAYTSDDLNYSDSDCRANLEMNDVSARPGIASELSALEDRATLYIGYPIWWGTAPRIINTLFEQYDLSGASIYLFCTSGGSGIERSVSDLQAAYPEYQINGGHRFPAGASAESIQTWLDSLDA